MPSFSDLAHNQPRELKCYSCSLGQRGVYHTQHNGEMMRRIWERLKRR